MKIDEKEIKRLLVSAKKSLKSQEKLIAKLDFKSEEFFFEDSHRSYMVGFLDAIKYILKQGK